MKYCASCDTYKYYSDFFSNRCTSTKLDVYCKYCRKKKYDEKQEMKKQLNLETQFIENEIWKDIPGFDNYECSTEGRIRNKKRNSLIKPSKDNHGYAVSSLMINKERKNIKFHRIIALTFLPNFENKPTVEHKDGNKFNNKLYNLKWATHKEQINYAIQNNLLSSRKGIKLNHSRDCFPNEKWKQIKLYPEYEISNMGRVKYLIRKGPKPYKQKITYGGGKEGNYKTFKFINNEISKIESIHRIVALEFIDNPNPHNYNIVNHIDGNKSNNSVENLEWCSRSQNIHHAYDNNLIKSKRNVFALSEKNEIIKEFESLKDAGEYCNRDKANIHVAIKSGNLCANLYWCYKEEYNPDKSNLKKNYKLNKKVKQICPHTNETIKIWCSVSEAQRNLKINNISGCATGKHKTAGGFIWKY